MENLQGTVEEAETGSCDSAGEALATLWGKGYLGILWLRLLRKNNLTTCPDYELDKQECFAHSLHWTKNAVGLFILPCVYQRKAQEPSVMCFEY